MTPLLRPLAALLIASLGMGAPTYALASEDATDSPLDVLEAHGLLLRLDSAVLVPLEGAPRVSQGGFYLDDTQAYRIAARLKEANEALGKPPSDPLPPLYEQRTESPVLTAVLGITIGFALGITLSAIF